jgi:hypothetical protein
MRARLIATFLLVFAAALAATPAMAQGVEFSVGYAFLRDDEIKENFPLGWYADIAGGLSDSISLVGEVGGSYKTVNDSEFPDLNVKLSVHHAMGGLRLSHRGDGANFYAQVLAGAARASVSDDFGGGTETVTDFALQPGVGLEFGAAGTRLRIGADYRRIFSEGQAATQWRATAGIVFGGSR